MSPVSSDSKTEISWRRSTTDDIAVENVADASDMP